MTIAQLLSSLFNLGAQTDFWNSNAAARDFWIAFAVALVAGVVYFSSRKVRRSRRGHRFGNSI
jgi:asparagine N-glycosylation enzyme membrane subunit Stt3